MDTVMEVKIDIKSNLLKKFKLLGKLNICNKCLLSKSYGVRQDNIKQMSLEQKLHCL